eukprot:TRINITY_DN6679_c5_g1_i1.p1 TRINITY_DN6679_c5_g1~~TRINITY_DN6679_c5_g1_i1.p1  ORF type:complete len:364 (+),score=46.69 TRINITY_DN6679_c5_g1_i1:61-1092(+)
MSNIGKTIGTYFKPTNGKHWTPGARSVAPGVQGMGFRENMARGRKRDNDNLGNDPRRPLFDLMGKLQEWAQEKQMTGAKGRYFYLDFLVDMEGYPKDLNSLGPLSRIEHLNLTLLSLAEERKFWKAFYFFVQQYEYENEQNVVPLDYLKNDLLIYALRCSGLASPKIASGVADHGIDDSLLAGISLKAEYESTNFPDDLLNMLDGNFLHQLFVNHLDAPPEKVNEFIQALQNLKTVPVEIVDEYENVLDKHHLTFDEIPDLQAILAAFGIDEPASSWYFDVRGFYSTPGKMIFDDLTYHTFLLDWFFTGAYKYGLPGTKCIRLSKRIGKEHQSESSRGWFHVI